MMSRSRTRPVADRGEAIAARFLQRRGFEILARNVRSRLGEIDLVARDGRTLVFVEVKTRSGPVRAAPQAAVDRRKQRRLVRLALGYLARRGRGDWPSRFDVVAVTLDPARLAPVVEHFPGAFTLDGWSG